VTLSAARLHRTTRIFALCLALLGLFGVSVAAASPAHEHATGPANSCTICFVAHLAALQAHTVHAVFALEFRGRASLPLASSDYTPVVANTSSTRGPPVLLTNCVCSSQQ
jgi:hypothetical protein